MDSGSSKLFNDSRLDLRIPDNSRITWSSDDSSIKGKAKIRNISASGLLLETNTECLPSDEHNLLLEPLIKSIAYIPKRSRLIWSKKKRFSIGKYEHGVRFIEPSESVVSSLSQKIQEGILRLNRIRKTEKFFNIIFFVFIAGLTGYILWINMDISNNFYSSNRNMSHVAGKQSSLIQNYLGLYQSTELALQTSEFHLAKSEANLAKSEANLERVARELGIKNTELFRVQKLYADGQQMLTGVRKELSSTMKILADTEKMLAEMKEGFKSDVARLNSANKKIASEMSALQDKIKYYQGDILNLTEGNALLVLYRSKMKLVKSKIRIFKKEAEIVKKAALAEKDRIKMLLGNNGYFMKAGKNINTDMATFYSAVLDSAKVENVTTPDEEVNINVTFVE